MFLQRIKSEGLAHYSYYLADGSQAVVIDPRRDVDVYLDLARDRGERITRILDTHRHEDYVHGSPALAAATGAGIVHGGGLDFEYGTTITGGDRFDIGRLRITALETPGHTPESMTYAVADTDSSMAAVLAFTGDALLVGDTGRIDLLGPERAPELAGALYDSLTNKILTLGDGVLLYPAHGGGSVCGGAISDREQSSIGFERLYNPTLAAENKHDFVRAKLAESHLRPPYFARMEEWNRCGSAPVYQRIALPPLSPGELAEHMSSGAVVVDARMPQAFAAGHIPGSYNIWRAGLAAYLGWVVPVGTPVLLVLPQAVAAHEAARTLLRIGYDDMIGYLRGGFESWQNDGREVARHGTIDTLELRRRRDAGDDLTIIDVRPPGEQQAGSVPGAVSMFVGDLQRRAGELPRSGALVTMCSVGHRGGLAASILARQGFGSVYNYLGGYQAWKTHEG